MSLRGDRLAALRRTVLDRRRIGRVVMVAAVVAAITSLVGIVVAWQLVGNLRSTTRSTLVIVEDTLTTVDDTLDVAGSVIDTVDGGVATIAGSLTTLQTSVQQGADALEAVAQLTEDLPPSLDRIDEALGGLQAAGEFVDDTLSTLADLPFGPDYDPELGLGGAVAAVRTDVQPLADDLRTTTSTLRELAGSSGELVAQLDALGTDLEAIDRSLDQSRDLLDRYRASTANASALARDARDDVSRDVTLSRILIVVLGVAIAVGQVAPFRIGRELAQRPQEISALGSSG